MDAERITYRHSHRLLIEVCHLFDPIGSNRALEIANDTLSPPLWLSGVISGDGNGLLFVVKLNGVPRGTVSIVLILFLISLPVSLETISVDDMLFAVVQSSGKVEQAFLLSCRC
jgi:hypothetical protein